VPQGRVKGGSGQVQESMRGTKVGTKEKIKQSGVLFTIVDIIKVSLKS
jgi:hypothetical protein